MTASTHEIRRWRVARLRPHPAQADVGDLPEAELAALAADIARNGLAHPIEALPDGVVVGGHQRLRAVKRLGWKTVSVRVRADLAGDARRAEEYVLTDNLLRRQLSPLAAARIVARLTRLEQAGHRPHGERGRRLELRDRVGQRLGVSGRNAQRYLRALHAPPAVQRAFDEGRLSLVAAGRVGCLAAPERARLDQALAAGVDPVRAVEEALGAAPRARPFYAEVATFLRGLTAGVQGIAPRLDRFPPKSLAAGRPLFRQARALLDALLAGAPERGE